MDKIAEWNRMIGYITTEPLHYQNTPGLANTPENARKFRIASIKELIEYEKEKDKLCLEQALSLNL